MEPTQITKSETFAIHFATMITIQAALKEFETLPAEQKAVALETILTAVTNHPTPAEA